MKKLFSGTMAIFILFSTLNLSAQKSPKDEAAMEKTIQSLIKKMTLQEKSGMLHGNSKFYVSGVKRLGIPEWALSDGPHGVRAEINRDNWAYAGWTNDSSTCFPPGTALAASWNPRLAYERGLVLGEEARYRRKDILLGPAINVIRSPLCGRNFEYLSEDPYLIAAMTVPYIKALQSKDVAASVKHYIANNQEENRVTVDVSMSDRTFHEIYLPGFKAAIQDGGSFTVMAAYNKFRGDWCSESEFLDRQILRNELGFKGVLMTDWNAAHSTVKAAMAGLDLEMGTDIKDYNKWYFADPLIEAVKEGKVPVSVVDEKVANILRVMLTTKMLDEKNREKGSMNTPAHQKAAYKSAAEAIVLLQNRNNVLPVDFSTITSIAVIGDNATRKHCSGGLSSEIKALYEITPLEAITRKSGNKLKINIAQGYEKQSKFVEGSNKGQTDTKKVDWKLIDEAVEAAKKSDVAVIVCGLNHDFDTESFDRQDMKLPYGQETLIAEVAKVNPRTIVVIIAGSPLELAGITERVPAILWAWYGGMEAGNAVADALSGKINPSGKMPFTLPVTLDQSPAHALGNFPGRNLKVNYEEGILVGYRWFDTRNIMPQFPFGFGLSYTSFEISGLKADKGVYGVNDVIHLSYTIKNTGRLFGGEVAQVYANDPVCSVMRPARELKGFEKVFLQPGDSQTVTTDINVSDLAFYDEMQKKWVVEPGDFILELGNSSRNLNEKTVIKVQ
jgi:beta-glucosidase